MTSDFLREREIRRTLRKLSLQRVALVLQPGSVWVIERAIPDNAETDAALKTCYMRGWVEPLENAVPTGKLAPDGTLPKNFKFAGSGPFYRLTSAGWSIIYRSYQLAQIAFLISVLSLVVSIANVLHLVGR